MSLLNFSSRKFKFAPDMMNENRIKWYDCQIHGTIFEIHTIFEVPKKWRLPHLRHLFESPYIHVHIIALNPLEKSSERKLEAARLSPRPRSNCMYMDVHGCMYWLFRRYKRLKSVRSGRAGSGQNWDKGRFCLDMTNNQ